MSAFPCTQGGWVWYCDAHDTHGNADSKEEAVFVSESHKMWEHLAESDDECDITIVPGDTSEEEFTAQVHHLEVPE